MTIICNNMITVRWCFARATTPKFCTACQHCGTDMFGKLIKLRHGAKNVCSQHANDSINTAINLQITNTCDGWRNFVFYWLHHIILSWCLVAYIAHANWNWILNFNFSTLPIPLHSQENMSDGTMFCHSTSELLRLSVLPWGKKMMTIEIAEYLWNNCIRYHVLKMFTTQEIRFELHILRMRWMTVQLSNVCMTLGDLPSAVQYDPWVVAN